MFLLVLWRLLEAFVGHQDKEEGADRWKARAVSVGKAIIYAVDRHHRRSTSAIGANESGGGGSTWTQTVMGWPAGQWIVALVGLAVIAYGANHVRKGFTEKLREAPLVRGQVRPGGQGLPAVRQDRLHRQGHRHRHRRWPDPVRRDHPRRQQVRQPRPGAAQGAHLPVRPGAAGRSSRAGLICYGLFCFARARHLVDVTRSRCRGRVRRRRPRARSRRRARRHQAGPRRAGRRRRRGPARRRRVPVLRLRAVEDDDRRRPTCWPPRDGCPTSAAPRRCSPTGVRWRSGSATRRPTTGTTRVAVKRLEDSGARFVRGRGVLDGPGRVQVGGDDVRRPQGRGAQHRHRAGRAPDRRPAGHAVLDQPRRRGPDRAARAPWSCWAAARSGASWRRCSPGSASR